MIFVFDTETTGVPGRGELITSPGYPRIVELAGVLLDPASAREVSCFSMVIRPEGYRVPPDMVHGISHERALAVGVPVKLALAVYSNFRRLATEVAGHNVLFDLGMVLSEFHRAGVAVPEDVRERVTVCTGVLGRPVCQLPPTERMIAKGYGDQFKPPSLTELHTHLFGEGFDGAHGALADVRATARCLLELRRLEHAAA